MNEFKPLEKINTSHQRDTTWVQCQLLIQKVNELVDKVNNLETQLQLYEKSKTPTKEESKTTTQKKE